MKRLKLFMVLTIVIGVLALSPELAAMVVKARAAVTPEEYSGNCPKRFEFVGEITVDKPGVVKYKWIRSDGAMAPVKTLRGNPGPSALPPIGSFRLKVPIGKQWRYWSPTRWYPTGQYLS